MASVWLCWCLHKSHPPDNRGSRLARRVPSHLNTCPAGRPLASPISPRNRSQPGKRQAPWHSGPCSTSPPGSSCSRPWRSDYRRQSTCLPRMASEPSPWPSNRTPEDKRSGPRCRAPNSTSQLDKSCKRNYSSAHTCPRHIGSACPSSAGTRSPAVRVPAR